MNFWDYILAAVTQELTGFLNILPAHEPVDLTAPSLGVVGAAVEITFRVARMSNLNFGLLAGVGAIIVTIEMVRWVYAGYMWVKRAIPVVG